MIEPSPGLPVQADAASEGGDDDGAIDHAGTELAALVDELRALAGTSVVDAAAGAERALVVVGERGELLYLLAELKARSGRSHEAIDLIDRAEAAHRAAGNLLEADRCAVGRISVLDDLGRHDEAIETATYVIERLTTGDVASDPHEATVDVVVRALSNRALVLETVGSYVEALGDYDRALTWSDRIDALTSAQIAINRASILDLLGRSAEAIDGLVAAVPVLESEGEREDLVKAAANIGSMMCRRGLYDAGLAWLARAEALVERGTDDECAIFVETAEVVAGLGALDEAIGRYRDALAVLGRSPISWLEGRAWLGLGICLARAGQPGAARDALRTSIDAFQASDNLPLTVASLLELASVESADPSMTAIALDQLQRAFALADADRWPVQACLAQLRLGELTPGAEGERYLRASFRLAERAGLAPLTMRVRQRLGRHLLRHGRLRDARPHVEAAVEVAETLRGRLGHQSLLRMFPAETASCYDDLVALRLAEGDASAAFAAADRGRSRSLVDAPVPASAGAGGAVDERDDAADIAAVESSRVDGPARLRAIETDLDVIYDRLLGAVAESARERSLLEQRARELEAQLERWRFDLRPTHPVLPSPTIAASMEGEVRPTLADGATRATVACDQLETTGTSEDDGRPDVTLMFHAVGDVIGVFVRRADGSIEWHDSIASAAEVAAEMDRFQAEGRRAWALSSAGIDVGDVLVATATRRLQRLGGWLLGPVWQTIASTARASPSGICRVSIAPTGVLWSVPFHALGCDGVALIDIAVVSTTPSPTMQATRHVAIDGLGGHRRRSLVVGVPGAGVPGAAKEAGEVASVRPDAVVLIDDQATLDEVGRSCAGCEVVHLATHGVFRQRSPLQSGVRLADGWLTAHRAAELPLDGAVVVLSACDTGRASITDGEEVLGAQYGFFRAGARTVVMALWPAHDERTVALMRDLHVQLVAGRAPSTALRAAQLAFRDRDPHPWWWAAFVASGVG